MTPKVVRYLSSGLRGEEQYASREDLPTLILADLRRAFDPPTDDPLMYDSYEVTSTQQEFIETLVAHSLDLERFRYWVECEAAE